MSPSNSPRGGGASSPTTKSSPIPTTLVRSPVVAVSCGDPEMPVDQRGRYYNPFLEQWVPFPEEMEVTADSDGKEDRQKVTEWVHGLWRDWCNKRHARKASAEGKTPLAADMVGPPMEFRRITDL